MGKCTEGKLYPFHRQQIKGVSAVRSNRSAGSYWTLCATGPAPLQSCSHRLPEMLLHITALMAAAGGSVCSPETPGR